MSKLIIDCATGEEQIRPLNKKELDQEKIDIAANKERFKIEQSELDAREAARQAILDRLGLTADEAKLLLG
jgi:hypothetical protein